MEIYRKYRPQKFADVVGQEEVINILRGKVKAGTLPHSVLLAGPSGCGKTTLARILAKELCCGPRSLHEINAAKTRGIDTVRDIDARAALAPLDGPVRVWVFDEAHQLTKKKGGDAQTALLKVLEEPPDHAYFFLCTTHPRDLLATIRNRCLEVVVRPLTPREMTTLLLAVLGKEGVAFGKEVVRRIVAVSEGSARKALMQLEKVLGLATDEERLEAVLSSDVEKQAIDIARALIRGAPWAEVAEIIKQVEEDPEDIRRAVLGYAGKVLLNGTGKGPAAGRAVCLLDAFRDHYYDCGPAGLIHSCFTVSRKGL